jgi:K+-sensing histidine kinase KdpD
VSSIPGTILSAIVLLCVAGFCQWMKIGKDASMLLLLFAVLGVSKLEGLLNGLIATVIAAATLAYSVFAPADSLMIKSSSDRLALALFLLLATLGSRMIAGRQRSLS